MNPVAAPLPAAFARSPRHFRDHQEFVRWFEILALSFSEWYGPSTPSGAWLDSRHVANCRAAIFPDFLHQLRDTDGRAVGYLATTPGHWSGQADALQDFDHVVETLEMPAHKLLACTALYLLVGRLLRRPQLFDRLIRGFRQQRQAGANAIVLLSMAIDPAYRGQQLPTHLLEAVRERARALGYPYILAPFRPSHYGQFKAERRAGHGETLFREYCALQNEQGLPADPWLRNVVRQGARLVRPEWRSLRMQRSLPRFEAFRARHRPDDWYSPAPGVWECGETPTWYVDPVRKLVTSWEPNVWGLIEVEAASTSQF